jgi:hypothetical protein
MLSKNKCNNPKRDNHSVQKKNKRIMKRTSLYPREVDRVRYLEDKEPYMVPVKSARINENKKPALPCSSQSFTSTSRNTIFHMYIMNDLYISIEVTE